MKLTRLSLVDELPEGTQLQAVEGRITAVYEYNTGEHPQHGPWSMQNCTLEGDGVKVKVLLKDRPELHSGWKGKNVVITAYQNDKGKWSGIKTEDNDYNGTVTRRLRITGSANIEDSAGGGQSEQYASPKDVPQQRQQAPQQQRHQSKPQQQQRQQTQQQGSDPTLNAKKMIARIATLQIMCYDAAVQQAWTIFDRHGYAILPGTVGIMADKLFMESIRRIELDQLPFTVKEPLKGRPLAELLPYLEESIDKGIERRTAAEERAKREVSEPVTRPQNESERRELPPPQGEESITDGMEDDDIPF